MVHRSVESDVAPSLELLSSHGNLERELCGTNGELDGVRLNTLKEGGWVDNVGGGEEMEREDDGGEGL